MRGSPVVNSPTGRLFATNALLVEYEATAMSRGRLVEPTGRWGSAAEREIEVTD